jgi:hypothetical protein
MTTVGPQTFTHALLVYDNDSNGFGGPLDMTGPEVGQVRYFQEGNGSLHVRIELNFGQPNTTYDVFLTCGPSHDLACGFSAIDTLTTDAVGFGVSVTTVSIAVLQAPPFGPGYRSDHIDLIQVNDPRSILTAGAINYFVCTREGTPRPQEGERERVMKGEGDPSKVQAQARQGDPAATHA